MNMLIPIFTVLVAASFLGVAESPSPQPNAIHPFHVSIAEIEFNPKSGKLEIALRVWPEDLEKALNRAAGKESEINLDSTPDLDQKIADYLKSKIQIKDPTGKSCPFTWVGKEIEIKHAWLYFEIETKTEPVKFQFSNSIFFELQDDQVNLFHIKTKDRRATLTFKRDKAKQKLEKKDFIPIQNPFADRD